MPRPVIEELLENLIYDAVVEYREELEDSREWSRIKEEFETIGKELKSCLCANTSTAETEEKVKKTFCRTDGQACISHESCRTKCVQERFA